MLPQLTRPKLMGCLVTQVDGSGRGSIGISVSNGHQRADRRVSLRRPIGNLRRSRRGRARVGRGRRPARRAGGPGRRRNVPEMLPSWPSDCSREA